MIVHYSDFIFVKDEGLLALALKRDDGEPLVLRRIHLGDSLADLVGVAWIARSAPPEVVAKAVD